MAKTRVVLKDGANGTAWSDNVLPLFLIFTAPTREAAKILVF